MIIYLLDNMRLFLMHMDFMDNLLVNFFDLIHKKLQSDNEYDSYYNTFLTFLESKKEIFYTKIFQYSGEYGNSIIEINNLLWGGCMNSFLDSNVLIGYIFKLDNLSETSEEFIFKSSKNYLDFEYNWQRKS